jgi:hypothetical protein
MRRQQSPGLAAYMEFLEYIKKGIDVDGPVKFKIGSHYKKLSEQNNPGAASEKIYKEAKALFDSDSRDTKNKLIEKFKNEQANKPRKPRKSKKQPTNYSETSN